MTPMLMNLKALVDGTQAKLVNPDRESRPSEIAHFRIERRLGAGATATVYEAMDTELKRKVVLKVLRPDSLPDGMSRDSLMAEARSLAALIHPHVMPLYQALWHRDEPVLVFPRYEGRTLQEALAHGIDNWKIAVGIVRDLADALAYTHSQDIIHRDIKPSNVWLRLDADGVERPLVFDFGLAGMAARIAGTPGYRPPAGAVSEWDGKAADVFSLVVVLFVLTRGIDGVPARVNATLSRLLTAGPENRPTAAEVHRQMQRLLHPRLSRRQMIGAFTVLSGVTALSTSATHFLVPPPPRTERERRPFAIFAGAANAPFAVSEDAGTFCSLDHSANLIATFRGRSTATLFLEPGFSPRCLAVSNDTVGGMIAAANDATVVLVDSHSQTVVASYDAIGLIQDLAWSGEDHTTLIVLREGTLATASQGDDRRFPRQLTETGLWPGWSPITDGIVAIATKPGFDTVAALLTHNTIVTWSLKKSRMQGIHRLTTSEFLNATVPPLIGWRSMDALYVVEGQRVTSYHFSSRIVELIDLPSTVSSLAWLHGDVLAFVSSGGVHTGRLGCILQSKPGLVLWLPDVGERIVRVDSARNGKLLVVGSADGRVMLFKSADVMNAILAEAREA